MAAPSQIPAAQGDFMRRFAVALVLPLLLVACTSTPRVTGRYAVEVDTSEQTRGWTESGIPAIQDAVKTALAERVALVDAAAAADAVIVLRPGPFNSISYEILRGNSVAERGSAGAVYTSQQWRPYGPSQAGAGAERDMRKQVTAAGQRVARQIIRDLARL
jgi:hypothetical protein